MPKTEQPYLEAAIMSRIGGQDETPLSAAAAESILTLGFSDFDKARMQTLSAKARQGSLTAEEQAEVEAYSRAGSLLGIIKSKARRALKSAANHGKSNTD